MIAFAASCVALLLFLWLSFGGSVPLAPQGYRISVEFNQAVQLGTQADVDIAGVTIGKVVSVGLDHRTGLTRAVLQIDPKYAPRPADTRAILRQKTLLGETYVELSFGNPRGPMLHDGAQLPQAQVAPTVQLDQILDTFDPQDPPGLPDVDAGRRHRLHQPRSGLQRRASRSCTRSPPTSHRCWRCCSATAPPPARCCRRRQVLSAISRNPAQLQGLIRNANTVFSTTAARNSELAAAVKAFPAFLVSTRLTMQAANRFAAQAKPLVDKLKPAAVQLSPALVSIGKLAPNLETVFNGLGPLTSAAQTGVPALESFLATSSNPARARPSRCSPR